MLRYAEAETAAGLVMLAGAVAALIWANSPWHAAYERLWETHLSLSLGDLIHLDHLTLRDWVNDLLMALFFFVVALEIKRELVRGELRDPRAAALPVLAALGGMILPATIYLTLNAGGVGSRGWGIPMATDIAFAVGVLSLVSRVPSGVKLFLLTLAIVDDLAAIVVIAVFYTSDLSLGWLAFAVLTIVGAFVLQRIDVRALVPYVVLASLCWLAVLESGVHATIAGVAFGLLTPASAFFGRALFPTVARELLDRIELRANGDDAYEEEESESALRDIARFATEVEAPLDRLEHRLVPWASYGVVPLFAFANAGVRLSGDTIADAATNPITIGIMLGLVVGKTLGVFSFTWLAAKARIGRLPAEMSFSHVFGVAIIAGIGFTVALFIANLSFASPALTDLAKIGILGGSLIAGVLGYTVLRVTTRPG